MGERALAFLAGGLEATKGTAVAATRLLLARPTTVTLNQPRAFVSEDRGTLVDATRFNAGVKDYQWTLTAQGVSFEQLSWFLQTCSKGSVTPTTVGTTGKQWVFSPNTTTTGDDLQAATIELGDDTQGYRMTYNEGDRFTLSFATLSVGQAAPLDLTIDYVAQTFASNTRTAGLATPAVESVTATANGTWQIGSNATAFSALPTISSQLRAFSFHSDNALGRKVFVGDPNLTYSNIGRGRRISTFTGQFEADANGTTRFVDWDLATPKRMRLTLNGTTVAGSAPATAKSIQIQGQVYFLTFNPIGVHETNTVYDVSGRFIEDATLPTANSDYSITVVNDQAAAT